MNARHLHVAVSARAGLSLQQNVLPVSVPDLAFVAESPRQMPSLDHKIMHHNRYIHATSRTITLAAASLVFATVSLAQPGVTSIKLEITGLTKKTVVLQLISADLITVSSEAGARNRQASSGQAYRITRAMDSRSARIREAAESGKILERTNIKFDGVDGEAQGVKVALGRAYIAEYTSSATTGGSATESFLLHFASTSTYR